eukprot:SAG31_NODE_3890_length_3777_cov_5.473355_3_plen_57_part_00
MMQPLYDTSTDVIWLQTGKRCGDIRIAADRPALTNRTALHECTDEELIILAGQDAW